MIFLLCVLSHVIMALYSIIEEVKTCRYSVCL